MLSTINKLIALGLGATTILTVTRCAFPGTYQTWTEPTESTNQTLNGVATPEQGRSPTSPDNTPVGTQSNPSGTGPENAGESDSDSNASDAGNGNENGTSGALSEGL